MIAQHANPPIDRARQARAWGAWDRLVMRFDAQAFPVVVDRCNVQEHGPDTHETARQRLSGWRAER